MLSDTDKDFLLGLISAYKKDGYKYYLCSTISDRNSEYDFVIYFSKEEIQSLSNLQFKLKNAIVLQIDSSTYYYTDNNNPRINLLNSNLTDTININQYEFIYTNSTIELSSSHIINPDITLSNNTSYDIKNLSITSCMLLAVIFIYIFIHSILRLKN